MFSLSPRFALCVAWLAALLLGLLPHAVRAQGKDAALDKESSAEAVNTYADAASFQNNGAFNLAVKEWEKFVKNHPKDPLLPKVLHYRGVCYLQLEKPDHAKAEASLAETVTKFPMMELIQDAMLNLGWCQYQQAQAGAADKFKDAAKTFGALAEQYPKDKKGKFADQALFYQAESLYLSGQRKESVAPYAKLMADHPESMFRADGLYALGVTHEELQQYAEAGKVYDVFIKELSEKKPPLLTEVRMRKAETLLQANDFKTAEKILGEVAGEKGFSLADHALYRQAYAVLKQDRFADAGVLYAKIPEAFPQSTYVKDAIVSAGRCYYRGDKFAEAAPWFQKVVEGASADVPEAAHWLCRIDLRNGKPDPAAARAAQVLPKAKDSPYFVNLKMDQADALYEIPAKRAESLDLYAKIATEHPEHELAPQALYNAAFAALDLKKFDDGLKQSTAFQAKFKDHRLTPDVKNVAAECQLQLGKHAEAEAVFRDLTAKHAEHADIETWRVRLGLVQYLQKKYPETIDTLKPLLPQIKTPNAVAESQFLIGASSFYTDKPDLAIAALSASLAANAKWRQADETLLVLARAHRKQNALDEAIKAAKRLVTEFPESKLLDAGHFRLGEFSYAADDYKSAVAEYDVVLQKWGDSAYAPYAMYGKGWGQLKLRDFKNAAESFTGLITKHKDHKLTPDSRFARALCRRQTEDHKGVIEDVGEFLKSNPDVGQKANALYERGLSEVALKEYPAAVATFGTILKENPKYENADKVLYELAWAHKSQSQDAEAVTHFAALAKDYGTSALAGEAFFHVGEEAYDKKNFADAVKSYTEAQKRAGKTEIGEKTAYKLGWANFQLKQYQPAADQFAKQLTDFKDGSLAPDATFMKAESLFKLEKHAEAHPAFVAARDVALKSDKLKPEIKALILLHGGQSACQLKKWTDGLAFLEPIPTDFKESPYVAEALYEIGWAKHNLKKSDEALVSFEQAATKSRGAVGARARFMMGELHFEAKRFDDADAEFQRVMFGYGGDAAPDEVKNWQAKAGFEAGRCAEVQIMGAPANDKERLLGRAKKAYQYLLDKHANHELTPKAKERLAALVKL